LVYKLRDVGTPEAKQHAKEAAGAAKIARAWGRALDKEHRAKLRSAKKARSPATAN
jgi:hypothetical protein